MFSAVPTNQSLIKSTDLSKFQILGACFFHKHKDNWRKEMYKYEYKLTKFVLILNILLGISMTIIFSLRRVTFLHGQKSSLFPFFVLYKNLHKTSHNTQKIYGECKTAWGGPKSEKYPMVMAVLSLYVSKMHTNS